MNMIIHNPVMANDQRTEVNGEQSLGIKSLEWLVAGDLNAIFGQHHLQKQALGCCRKSPA